MVEIGEDVTIISSKSWHPDWPLQEISVQLLGIVTLSQIKQSAKLGQEYWSRRTERKIKATCGQRSNGFMGVSFATAMETTD